ncbi:equilibrative nucleoside transporter 3-like [Ruditapes philippinarum]|uniref:equilibrative nucleoside transporter 3-like n=1 Tax=Ruditapes philippinarum TaxID=129788 RepID=UPI00295AC6FF|nr:equilibrative nucleoside transporter 3-like [Ruditapes philippinarum]
MDTSEDPLLPQVHGPIPRDRFHMVYLIFYLLGLGSLAPWNFFITASEYFKYKLRNTTQLDDEYLDPNFETELQAMFESYLVVANTVPNLAFNFITALIIQRVCLKTRMIFSLVLIILMFMVTVSLVEMDTDTWQTTFFSITLVTAVLISSGGSILGASLFGLASLFPSQYVQATMTGQAMGGIFAAVANLVTLAIGSHVIDSGLVFFMFAVFMAVLTLVGYGCLYCLSYSKYHILEIGNTISVDVNSHGDDIGFVVPDHGCSYYSHIFRKIWKEGISVCLVFLVTLSCFPAIASSIVSVVKIPTPWSEKYFSALVCFLLFNCGDWSGRSVAGSIHWPRYGQSSLLLMFSVLRVVFIPLLMFCNVQPRTSHIWFNSDIYPVVFILLLGLTNGYFGTLAMMYGPRRVSADKAESTGAMMSSFLTTGLVSGSLIAILLMKSL